jgi:hypothetical protein
MSDTGVACIQSSSTSVANRVVEKSLSPELPSSYVNAVRLDDLADEMVFGNVYLLKMNIEGAEKHSLKGMTKLVKSNRALRIYCHDFLATYADESMRTFDFVKGWLYSQGFKIVTRQDDSREYVRYHIHAIRENA